MAVASDQSGSVCIWDSVEKHQVSSIDTGYRGIGFLSWSADSERVAFIRHPSNSSIPFELISDVKSRLSLPIKRAILS